MACYGAIFSSHFYNSNHTKWDLDLDFNKDQCNYEIRIFVKISLSCGSMWIVNLYCAHIRITLYDTQLQYVVPRSLVEEGDKFSYLSYLLKS